MNKTILIVFVLLVCSFAVLSAQEKEAPAPDVYCLDSIEILKITKCFNERDYLRLDNESLKKEVTVKEGKNLEYSKLVSILNEEKKLMNEQIIKLESRQIEIREIPCMRWYSYVGIVAGCLSAGVLTGLIIK